MRTGGCFLLVLVAGCFSFDSSLKAQTPKTAPTNVSALCNRGTGANIVAEQISVSKTMDDVPQRIGVLIRAADVLWPHQEQKARAGFAEAMELAIQDFRDAGEVVKQEGRLPVQQPDQRFVVVAAIAKRDRQWARKLSDQVLDEEIKEAENKPVTDRADAHRAEKLLDVAWSLLPENPESAVTFARSSLRYTATIQVPAFLYHLAETNKTLADQFYQQALQAYTESPMEQFLYLSSYPFANDREVGELPVYTLYKVPSAVTPNPNLARMFIQTLLGRAQQLSALNIERSSRERYSDGAQMWLALNRLEPQVQSILPDLLPALQQARGTLQALLNETETKRASQSLVPTPKLSFDERIEDALKQSDPKRRQGSIALAIITGADGEPLDKVVAAADKIDDTALRTPVLSRLYFDRTLAALKEDRFDEAGKLAAKVDEVDQRAYLYSRIAADSIKQAKNEVEVREMLEEVVSAASKAPDTEIKARALLGIAYLYSRIDSNRAVSVLGDAVKSINKIEAPDFSRDWVIKRIEGKSFGYYTTLPTTGLNPDNAFREIGKFDFDGTLYQAANFTNKSLRSMTTIATVEPCLQLVRKTKQTKSKP
jgi:tetratricopeptide (TPR) repeat protein